MGSAMTVLEPAWSSGLLPTPLPPFPPLPPQVFIPRALPHKHPALQISISESASQESNLKLALYLVFFQRRQWHPTPVLLPGKSHEWRSLVGCSPWGPEKLDTTEGLHFHALEKEMATHSSVLVWRIPGKGEPGGLPSMGLHRVRHD